MKQSTRKPNSTIVPLGLIAIALGNGWAHADWKVNTDAIQSVYQKGVPHTDRSGAPMLQYDAARSFFPISIYNALETQNGGVSYRLADLKKAGFNCAFAWPGSEPIALAKSAEAAGLQMVFANPKPPAIKQLASSPSVLGYYLDSEPSRQFGADFEKRFSSLQEQRAAIKAVDKTHPVFLIEGNSTLPPRREWWVRLNTWGDISSHSNYAINSLNISLNQPGGIPETVALAAGINQEQKPVWFMTQSFERLSPTDQATFPSVTQQRCLVYSALIHGATGIIHFSLDSFVTRTANAIGISPEPKAKYTTGITATSSQLRKSRDMWDDTVALNAELEQLRPALLSPTAEVPYEIALDDAWKPITKDPLRTLLKVNPAGGYILLLANIDGAPQMTRVRFPEKKDYKLTELFNAPDASSFARKEDAFEFLAAPYDVRVFQIDLQ